MSTVPTTSTARPRIGRYVLLRKLGSGGQGTVYLARDDALEREVALKLVHADALTGLPAADALPDEARMAARMQHPNIVAIHDVGLFSKRPYLVFEYVPGRTMREVVAAEGAIRVGRALALMRPVLEAVAHAHERGVLHLDLTPGNVMLGAREVPRVMDFGLARLAGAVRDATAMPVGTLRYMAPEQLAEHPPGPQVDVRALALVLFELLTGRTAIGGRSVAQAIREIVTHDIDLSPIRNGAGMAPIAAFLSRALARDPAARHPDAVAMLHAFDEAFTARARIDTATDGGARPNQGTVEFLLRRMQRREDFPALSRSLAEINRMTSRESRTTAQQLATVVLRDFALTNKLLKLTNSAFYGVIAGEVRSVSHAISLLGFEQLRAIANSLTLFSHIKDRARSRALHELMVQSFTAGLIARHLAQREKMSNAEEAFICGMFQSLGETLTMFYFAEEYTDIRELAAQEGTSRAGAVRAVLGCDFATLGAAVAREWHFPTPIVDAIAGLPNETPVATPANETEQMRNTAVFADALCTLLGDGASADALAALQVRFRASIDLPPDALLGIAQAALEKLDAHCAVLGVETRTSPWCRAARECIEALRADGVEPRQVPEGTSHMPGAVPRALSQQGREVVVKLAT